MSQIISPLLLLACVSMCHAEVVTYNPNFDLSSDPNTSGTFAYAANGNALDSGIVDDGSSSIDAVSYSFSDSMTGIEFSYVVTYIATDGFLNPEPGIGDFGVGHSSQAAAETGWLDTGSQHPEQFEGLTFTISGLDVDLTHYIPGSIDGVVNPVLNGSAVGFSAIAVSSLDVNDTQLTMTDGTNTYFGQPTTTGPYSFSELGLSVTAPSFTIHVGDTVTETVTAGDDNRIRLATLTHNVALNIVDIPEPSSFPLIAGLGFGALALTRRRR